MNTKALLLAAAFAACGASAFAQPTIQWWTVDGGGAMSSSAGGVKVGGTIGQVDAGPGAAGMIAGSVGVLGGFWVCAASPPRAGDLNCDGAINALDIDPFVLALTSATAYGIAFPNCDWLNGDMNGDDLVNNLDIDAFVAAIVAGG